MHKILVLTSTYPRWQDDTEPNFIESLCKELSHKYEIHVLAPHYQNAALSEQADNIRVHRFRYYFRSHQNLAYNGGILANLKRNKLIYLLIPLFIFFQFIAVFRLNSKLKFDVIHAHWIIPQGLVAVLVRFLSKNRYQILLTSHGGDLFAFNNKFTRLCKSWVLKHCERITVVSEAMKKYCLNFNIGMEKISVCPMGVDLHKTFVPKVPFNKRNGIIFVGRLVEKKGVRYLIEAIAALRKEFPYIRLCIIGDGPERNALEKLAHEQSSSENISFIGAVSNREIPGYLNKAKIAVMPSVVSSDGDQEGLGLVAVEAMGCGCAVIASDLPAVRDIMKNSETGLLVYPGSAMGLAGAIVKLISNDREAENIAREGRKYVLNKFDWKSVGLRYQEMIAELV